MKKAKCHTWRASLFLWDHNLHFFFHQHRCHLTTFGGSLPLRHHLRWTPRLWLSPRQRRGDRAIGRSGGRAIRRSPLVDSKRSLLNCRWLTDQAKQSLGLPTKPSFLAFTEGGEKKTCTCPSPLCCVRGGWKEWSCASGHGQLGFVRKQVLILLFSKTIFKPGQFYTHILVFAKCQVKSKIFRYIKIEINPINEYRLLVQKQSTLFWRLYLFFCIHDLYTVYGSLVYYIVPYNFIIYGDF